MFSVGSIVKVKKKSRGRFPGGVITTPGDHHHMILSMWTSSYGNLKFCLLNEEGCESFTTEACVEMVTVASDRENKWDAIHEKWMEKTYIPLIITSVLSASTLAYKKPPETVIMTRDKNAVLVKTINNQKQFWLNRRQTLPDDWMSVVRAPPGAANTIRVPEWVIKKNNLLGSK